MCWLVNSRIPARTNITLLHQLISYWEIPNVFVVGDDDQILIQFQGANLRNLAGFIDKFGASVQAVTLDRNYRSSQLVLDTAQCAHRP